MNDESATTVSFKLYERHINLLDTINPENRTNALRILLDSIINGTEQTKRKQIMDTSMQWISLGAIFLFISYLLDPTKQLISILSGTFLFAYGIIGGILSVIQRTNHH